MRLLLILFALHVCMCTAEEKEEEVDYTPIVIGFLRILFGDMDV